MIIDYKGVTSYITNWMESYARGAGATSLVLGLSGGIDSALVALLARQTTLRLVCVNMPCHSSSSAYDRAAEFAASDLPGTLFKVDLSEAHESISKQFKDQDDNIHDWSAKSVAGGLRSCLRAPTLSFLAHATNGLIVGTGNRSEDRITRYFQKFGDGCVDFCPIADLYKSEVRDLFRYLAEEATGMMSPGAQAIYGAKPTADLWGADGGQEDEKELGISYDEIEWADREDVASRTRGLIIGEREGIIFGSQDPATLKLHSYTERQLVILHTLWKMEKISRHKHNPNLPVCDLHDSRPYLVK